MMSRPGLYAGRTVVAWGRMLARFSAVCMEVLALAVAPSDATRPWLARVDSHGEPYTLTGRVVATGGRPIPSADVVVVEPHTAERTLHSDSAGYFRAALATPSAVLRVRAVGFEPRTVAVSMPADTHQSSVTIELDQVSARLDTVKVADDSAGGDTKLREFYARKASNSFARFFDAADIEQKKPRLVSELLRSTPGIQLQPSTRIGNLVLIRGCAPLVWVDGVRMPGVQLDEAVAPDDVAALEIYNSFAGIPARYFDRTATCGTILVWLKS